MKITVLLSAGRHPVSGRAAPVPVELQAIRLARELGEASGLYAGPDAAVVADALGHGLGRIEHLAIPEGGDPLESLAAALADDAPELVLTGRCGQGGGDSGLLPYMLARRLGRPIVADAVALRVGEEPGTLIVEQALPKGARRRVTVRLPAVVTVHPAAPAPLPYAFGAARRGSVETRPGIAVVATASNIEEKPYRLRPKLIAKAAAGASAADRLKAATEASTGGGRLLVDPAPEDAAREIIAHLREIGVLRR